MIKRNEQLKKKQQIQTKPLNRAYVRQQLFNFPLLQQITSPPITQIRQSTTKVQQRFSAKIISKQQVKEPVIIKITTTKNKQIEEQSEYQLSELGGFDDLIEQIQEKVLSKHPDIQQLALDICQLDAVDLRSLTCIPQLIKHLVINSIKQQIQIPHILAILLTLTEEIITREDLDESLLEVVNAYISRYQMNLTMITTFLKRLGQMIYYLRPNRIPLICNLIVTMMQLFDDQQQTTQNLELPINVILRHRQIRLMIKESKDLIKVRSHIIREQFTRFKIN